MVVLFCFFLMRQSNTSEIKSKMNKANTQIRSIRRKEEKNVDYLKIYDSEAFMILDQ